MSVFTVHVRVLTDYRDFDRSFFTGADASTDGETPQQMAALQMHFPTPRDAVAVIRGPFPIVRQKDEQTQGRYRSRERILGIYDAMLAAQRSGRAYQTQLVPSPGGGLRARAPHRR